MQIGPFLNFRKWAELTFFTSVKLTTILLSNRSCFVSSFINLLMAIWFLAPRASLTLSVNRRVFPDVCNVSTQRKPKQISSWHVNNNHSMIHFLHLAGHLPSRLLGMLLAIIISQNINPNYTTSIYPNIHTSFCGIDYISNRVCQLFCAKNLRAVFYLSAMTDVTSRFTWPKFKTEGLQETAAFFSNLQAWASWLTLIVA